MNRELEKELEAFKEKHRLEDLEKEMHLKIKRKVKAMYYARGFSFGLVIGTFVGISFVTFLFLNIPIDGLIEIKNDVCNRSIICWLSEAIEWLMKEKIKYFVAGIFIGLSELLPGISGATVALMFGVYEKILNFLRKFNGLNLMIPLLAGMILSVFAFSSLINFLYQNYLDIFNLLIAILMIGYGIFLILNTYLKGKINTGINFYINIFFAILIGILINSFYINGHQEPQVILLILFGFIACSFLLFPGISGSAFLLSVGAYPLIIASISNLNFEVLMPFGIGMALALGLMPRLINKAYEKYGKSILVFFGGLIFAAGVNHFL